eukprot:5410232-Pleurochrysis_carterae.AAC.4
MLKRARKCLSGVNVAPTKCRLCQIVAQYSSTSTTRAGEVHNPDGLPDLYDQVPRMYRRVARLYPSE